MPVITRARARKFCQQCSFCTKDTEDKYGLTYIEMHCSISNEKQFLKKKDNVYGRGRPLYIGYYAVPEVKKRRKHFFFEGDFTAPTNCPFVLEMVMKDDDASPIQVMLHDLP